MESKTNNLKNSEVFYRKTFLLFWGLEIRECKTHFTTILGNRNQSLKNSDDEGKTHLSTRSTGGLKLEIQRIAANILSYMYMVLFIILRFRRFDSRPTNFRTELAISTYQWKLAVLITFCYFIEPSYLLYSVHLQSCGFSKK